jgi:Rap1a immunity proteins
MHRMRAISAFMFAALACSPVWAEGPVQPRVGIYMDGENLTQECRSFMITRSGRGTSQQVQQAARCYGYVTGVFDTLAELEGRVVVPFCIPEGTNANALTEIVATFLDKNPARRNHSGADLVSEAWSESFPCTSR